VVDEGAAVVVDEGAAVVVDAGAAVVVDAGAAVVVDEGAGVVVDAGAAVVVVGGAAVVVGGGAVVVVGGGAAVVVAGGSSFDMSWASPDGPEAGTNGPYKGIQSALKTAIDNSPAAHQDILELSACNCNTHEIKLLPVTLDLCALRDVGEE
jgi:hypothetical protein